MRSLTCAKITESLVERHPSSIFANAHIWQCSAVRGSGVPCLRIDYPLRTPYSSVIGSNYIDCRRVDRGPCICKQLILNGIGVVPKFVPHCQIPLLRLTATPRGQLYCFQRVTGYYLVPGGGIEPPWNCFRRILSFPRILYVYDK